jgi:hypothetical protein
MSLLASLCEEDGYRSRATSREGRGGAGTPTTPRPRLDRRPARGEPCGRGWGVLVPLHVCSPQPPTRVLLRSPAQDPWREIRESLPARLIVTAPTIGPMPERRSLNLMGSLPITFAVPTSLRDAHSQAPSLRDTPGSPGRRPSGLTGAQRRRVQSVNQSGNHSGAQSGAHS